MEEQIVNRTRRKWRQKKIWRLIKQKKEHETKMGKKEHRSGTEKNEKEKKWYWRNELYNSMDTERLDKKKIKGDKREKKEHSGKEND